MTLHHLLWTNRVVAAVLTLALIVLMVGPFQGLERLFGLSDLAAHALAFYGLSLMVFAIAPRWRRNDLALAVFGVGALIELAQTLSGRSGSVMDLAADGFGIMAAVLPSFIERLRHQTRKRPHALVGDLARVDRRRTAVPRSLPGTPNPVRQRPFGHRLD